MWPVRARHRKCATRRPARKSPPIYSGHVFWRRNPHEQVGRGSTTGKDGRKPQCPRHEPEKQDPRSWPTSHVTEALNLP